MACLNQENVRGWGELDFRTFSKKIPFLEVLLKPLLRLKN